MTTSQKGKAGDHGRGGPRREEPQKRQRDAEREKVLEGVEQLWEEFLEYVTGDVYWFLCEGILVATWWTDTYASNEAIFAHDMGLAFQKFITALQKGERTWECPTME